MMEHTKISLKTAVVVQRVETAVQFEDIRLNYRSWLERSRLQSMTTRGAGLSPQVNLIGGRQELFTGVADD